MSTPLRRYYNGPNGPASMVDCRTNQKRYFHYDHQGTVQCLTDETGAVTDRFASDAWGVQVKHLGTSINRQWYIGRSGYHRQADQALDYVRARYLSPGLGAFVSHDRLPSIFRFPESYAYASNSPAYLIDPTGQIAVSVFRKNMNTSCGSWDVAFNFILNKPAPPGGGFMVQMITIVESTGKCKKPQKYRSTIFWEAFAVEPSQVKYFKQLHAQVDLGTDGSTEPAHPNSHGSVGVFGTIKFFSAQTLARFGVAGGSLYNHPNWWNGRSGTVPQAGGIPSTKQRPAWFFGPSDDPPDGERGVSSEWCCCPPTAWSVVETWVGNAVVDTTKSGNIKICKTYCDECCLLINPST